ncbi:MAG: hypothetical protein ACTSVB_05640 [Candidatus Heimdallarchaeaceae archaeon]
MSTLKTTEILNALKTYLLTKNDTLKIYLGTPYRATGSNPEVYLYSITHSILPVNVLNTYDTFSVVIAVEATISSKEEEQNLWNFADVIAGYFKIDDFWISLNDIMFHVREIDVKYFKQEGDSVGLINIVLTLSNYE